MRSTQFNSRTFSWGHWSKVYSRAPSHAFILMSDDVTRNALKHENEAGPWHTTTHPTHRQTHTHSASMQKRSNPRSKWQVTAMLAVNFRVQHIWMTPNKHTVQVLKCLSRFGESHPLTITSGVFFYDMLLFIFPPE